MLCKPEYGSVRGRAPDSGCVPSVPLRIARVKEGCSYSYDLEIITGLYEKKNEKLEIRWLK